MFEKKPKVVNLQLIDDIISKQNSSKKVRKLPTVKRSEVKNKTNKKIDTKEPGSDIPWL